VGRYIDFSLGGGGGGGGSGSLECGDSPLDLGDSL
jgi:hypothetical protein